MANQWDDLKQRHEQLAQELASSDLDVNRRRDAQKEFAKLDALLAKHNEIEKTKADIQEARTQSEATALRQASDFAKASTDTQGDREEQELAELYRAEAVELEQKLAREERELDELMYPPSEHDNRSVFLEIRAGAGGQEAALFAADLLKMYTNYALKKNWQTSIVSASETDLKGYREVVLNIKGKNVYGHLKFESGVHRVQRVPETEASGRVHTSTATVAVLPEAKEVDVNINPSDLRIDVFRASGAGGQHVNTTDSAVRITHVPTGVVVSCQDERSQHKNKMKAMKMLSSRLLVAQMEKQRAEQSKLRKEQVGAGMRAEKVRTYNFPQNRVTDHQVNVTLKKLDMVMAGDLDEIITALLEKEREERREQPFTISY